MHVDKLLLTDKLRCCYCITVVLNIGFQFNIMQEFGVSSGIQATPPEVAM